MYRSASTCSRQSYRDRHRRRRPPPSSSLLDVPRATNNSSDRVYPLFRPAFPRPSINSCYDNLANGRRLNHRSKWLIVRQRLPDILALSETYKPRDVRSQLSFLIALMNQQSSHRKHLPNAKNDIDHPTDSEDYAPTSVTIIYEGRTQTVCLKRIPADQYTHVDIDELSFSIPVRELILAISQDNTRNLVVKYCPPAIREMLIEMSKTKIIDDRKQFKRALFKRRFVQSLFSVTFALILIMVFVLIISVTDAVVQLESFNYSIASS